jgi:WhiB family redox-sensing transcriptional regulator
MTTVLTQGWQVRGACRTYDDPEVFFPRSGGEKAARPAKEVCARCPVQPQCRQWALETRQEWGVWGGLSEDERRAQLGWGRNRTVVASGYASRAEQIAAESQSLLGLLDTGLSVFEVATILGTSSATVYKAQELLAAQGTPGRVGATR